MIRFDTNAQPTTLEQDLETYRAEVRRLELALARNRYHFAHQPLMESLDSAKAHVAWLEEQIDEQS